MAPSSNDANNLLLIAGSILLIVFNCHSMPWWLIVLTTVVGLIILLTGRAWCGYACPVGLVLDLVSFFTKQGFYALA